MKKFSSLLVVLLLMLASFTVGTQYPRGDVDYNGKVNISDVTTLIDYLLTGTWEEVPEDHEWVDLGLPSGTLWATCNVGAENPEDCGDYFAWGETSPKEVYSWSTYKWCNGTYDTMTKYCTLDYCGTVDNKSELDPEDDAAYVNWGPSWRMPTVEQQIELYEQCTWTNTTINDMRGKLITGPNGNSIFLPATGTIWDSSLHYVGENGYHWSRTLYVSHSGDAYSQGFYSGDILNRYGCDRYIGIAVRAVRVSQN